MIQQKGADRSRRSPDRGLPATIHLMLAEGGKAERCNQCGQELIEIDNRGERLVGCLTCNLWAAPNNAVDEAGRRGPSRPSSPTSRRVTLKKGARPKPTPSEQKRPPRRTAPISGKCWTELVALRLGWRPATAGGIGRFARLVLH